MLFGGVGRTNIFTPSHTLPHRYDFDGGVMLTASHLPFNRNGMKFFTKTGGLGKDDISAILRIAEGLRARGELPAAEQYALAPHEDFMPAYAAQLRALIVEGVGKAWCLARHLNVAHICSTLDPIVRLKYQEGLE